jgi:uncharacterized protein YciI
MPYIIIARDKPGSSALRAATRPEHLAYLKQHLPKLLAAGALLDDDAKGGDGSVLIYDTEDRAEAERFARDDPFAKAGLFATTEIRRWRKAIFAGELLG